MTDYMTALKTGIVSQIGYVKLQMAIMQLPDIREIPSTMKLRAEVV